MDVLDVMAERENICNYLDMPLQHISDNLLKSMRRGITKQKTIELINDIRNKIPDIALRTTLITGYPNETEQDFEEMLQWVQETKFDRLGCFTYSHEENTHAFTLPDNVDDETKQERANQIMEIQQDISLALNQQKIGKTFKVLIDRKETEHFVGRTAYDSPEVDNEVLIKVPNHYLRIGDFYNVKINDAEHFDLYGSIL